MFERKKLISEFHVKLQEFSNAAGPLYQGSEFNKADVVTYLLKFQHIDKLSASQIDKSRKELQTWLDDKKLQDKAFKGLLHKALLVLTSYYPINEVDENNQPIDGTDLTAIEDQDRIVTSDGYQYNINTLAAWIKSRGEWINYARMPFNEYDQENILNFAKQKGFDLSHLSNEEHQRHVREVEEKLSEDAVQQLQHQPQPQQRHYHARQHGAFFAPPEEILIVLYQITGIELDVLNVIAQTDPFAFENLSNLVDYLRANILTADEIIRRTHLSPDQGGFNQMRVTHLALAFPFVQRGVFSVNEALNLRSEQIQSLLRQGENMDRNQCRALIGLPRSSPSI